MDEKQGYMNSKEAAKYIGIPDFTLRVWVNEGIIPAYRPGGKVLLFSRKKIDEAILSNPVKSADD
jgi:excisionase family DNA binding protein